MADHREIDKILEKLEQSMLRFVATSGLTGATIERWRWDQPVVTLSWVANDDISRSINALVDTKEDGTPYEIRVEANAWQDEDLDKEGKMRERKWRQHKDFKPILVLGDLDSVPDLVAESYFIVSAWRKSDLNEREPLTSSTAGL